MTAIGRLDIGRWQAFRDAKESEQCEELTGAKSRLAKLLRLVKKNQVTPDREGQVADAIRREEARIAELTKTSRRLHEQLIKDNEPLTVVLSAQLCGRGENRPGRKQKFKRVAYVETLSLEEQDAACRIGMAKAIEKFDPKKRDAVRAEHGLAGAVDDDGAIKGLPAFAAYRIMYELQQAIEKAGAMTIRRGCAPQNRPGVERLDDPDHVERVLEESEGYLGASGESLQERLVREEAEDIEAKRGKKPRSAIETFIEARCRLVPGAPPVLWEWVTGKYEQHAHAMGQVALPVALGRRMRELGWSFGRMWHPFEGGAARSVCRLRVMTLSGEF